MMHYIKFLIAVIVIFVVVYYFKRNYEWFVNPELRVSQEQLDEEDKNYWFPKKPISTLYPNYPYYPNTSCANDANKILTTKNF